MTFENNLEKEIAKTETTCYPACSCQCGCPPDEPAKPKSFQIITANEPIRTIKVLDKEDQSNRQMYQNVLEAIQHLGLSPAISYWSDPKQTSPYYVDLPALVVDERAVTYGKLCTVDEIETLLQK